jgi:UDP-galactose transporter B1
LGATFILALQTVVNIVIALIWQRVEGPPLGAAVGQKLNHPLLAVTASAYVFAMVGSNEALRFVSYPTAVLAKSCKLIPTMVMGWAIERRTYGFQQWTSALLISFGIAIFNLSRIKEPPASHHGEHEDEYWKGMALLALSLGMDGFLGVGQGFLKRADTWNKNERPPSAVETMLWVNAYALLLLVPIAIGDNQWNEGIEILSRDEFLLKAMMLLNGVVGIGQIFIFLTITWYSSLVCTTITTTRKFFTILLSVIHFGHRFSTWQWLSTGMVFFGLYFSIFAKKAPDKVPSKQD